MNTLRLRRERRDDATLAALIRAALDEVGVGPHQEFTISARADYTPGDLESNQVVLGKSEVSKEVAWKVWPKTGTQRRMVIEALADGPKTRRQLAKATGLIPNSLRPRLLEAIDGGWVRQCARLPYVDGNEVVELTEKAVSALRDDHGSLF